MWAMAAKLLELSVNRRIIGAMNARAIGMEWSAAHSP
jgi:hypothetical protein